MNKSSKDPEMEKLLDHFIRSCFPSNYGEFTWGVELGELRQLKGPYLEAAKKTILDGLAKEPESRPIFAALEIKLIEAIPILQHWLQEIKSDTTKSRNESKTQGQLAYALYEFTKDKTYIDDLIDAVTKAAYGDFDDTVHWLRKVPLSTSGISAVWRTYKRGKINKNAEEWLDQCVDFLREKIKQPVGESFLNSLPAEEQNELFALIAETRQERIERNLRRDKYIQGAGRYNKEDLNRYDEYVQADGSPISGLTLKSIWRGHTNTINSLVWSQDGRHLASTSNDESVLIWNFEQDDCEKILIREKKSHSSEYRPKKVLWINGGQKLAGVYDYYSAPEEDIHGIAVWDLETEKLVSSVQPNRQDKSYINNLVCMPDGKRLLVSYYGHHANAIFLVDPLKGTRDLMFDLNDGILEKILLSPDGKTIAAG
jgi:WD40 repeat protein